VLCDALRYVLCSDVINGRLNIETGGINFTGILRKYLMMKFLALPKKGTQTKTTQSRGIFVICNLYFPFYLLAQWDGGENLVVNSSLFSHTFL
jgi:hypothetical protein